MGEKCLKQYHTYHECVLTSDITTLSQFSNFPNLGLKYHLPRVQSPVWGGIRFPPWEIGLILWETERKRVKIPLRLFLDIRWPSLHHQDTLKTLFMQHPLCLTNICTMIQISMLSGSEPACKVEIPCWAKCGSLYIVTVNNFIRS